jgi:hypothetical protein
MADNRELSIFGVKTGRNEESAEERRADRQPGGPDRHPGCRKDQADEQDKRCLAGAARQRQSGQTGNVEADHELPDSTRRQEECRLRRHRRHAHKEQQRKQRNGNDDRRPSPVTDRDQGKEKVELQLDAQRPEIEHGPEIGGLEVAGVQPEADIREQDGGPIAVTRGIPEFMRQRDQG